jgi:predicted CoA-binding protein
MLVNDDFELSIFKQYRKIAVVGTSANNERPSYRVLQYLLEHDFDVIPVNPALSELLGITCYPNLSSIPKPVEIVDIFRRSEEVIPVIEEAIKVRAKVIWMQEGVINQEAKAIAVNAGLLVVMDKCIRKEHMRFTEEGKL